MFLPMSSKIGLTVLNAPSLPPTMMVSVAFFAPTSPPDTGASRYSQPSSLMRLANFFVSPGEIDDMSTTILPFDSPEATPLSPKSAAATWGVSGTIVMMTSLFSATSLPDLQATAPAPVRSAGTGEMS